MKFYVMGDWDWVSRRRTRDSADNDSFVVFDTARKMSLEEARMVAAVYFKRTPGLPTLARMVYTQGVHAWYFLVRGRLPEPTWLVRPECTQLTYISDITDLTVPAQDISVLDAYNFCPRLERQTNGADGCRECPELSTCKQTRLMPLLVGKEPWGAIDPACTGRGEALGHQYLAPTHFYWDPRLAHHKDILPEEAFVKAARYAKRKGEVRKETVDTGKTVCPPCVFSGKQGEPCSYYQISRCSRAVTQEDIHAKLMTKGYGAWSLLSLPGFTPAQREFLMWHGNAEVESVDREKMFSPRTIFRNVNLGYFTSHGYRVHAAHEPYARRHDYVSWEELRADIPEFARMEVPPAFTPEEWAMYGCALGYRAHRRWSLRSVRVRRGLFSVYEGGDKQIRLYPSLEGAWASNAETLGALWADGNVYFDKSKLCVVP